MSKTLFDEVTIGNVRLPNRFARSATWEGMCDEHGRPGDRLANLYTELAEGGVGLIISGYTVVHPKGRQMKGSLGGCADTQIPAMHVLTDKVHAAGGILFAQLVHAGAQTSTRVIGETPLAPSAVPSPFYSGTPREMTPAEIQEAVESFAQAARRAKEAGFDGVQFHGAHGYLINQFLSPLTNQRTDGFGGSPQSRFRFLKEIYVATRELVGEDYPVIIKLPGSDNLEGGLAIKDAVQHARWLEELGIDAIEVSAGTAGSGDGVPVRKGINKVEKEAYNAHFAREIRKAVDVPLLVVGGLRSYSVIEKLLAEDVADIYSLSRPLIREPDLVSTWKTDPGHKSTCISCNLCFRPGMREGGIYCPVEKKAREKARLDEASGY
jgi:2,4-dienoyl-CoA reductase-like NADH-dependent reductase (Old Yellow Enzyme family)